MAEARLPVAVEALLLRLSTEVLERQRVRFGEGVEPRASGPAGAAPESAAQGAEDPPRRRKEQRCTRSGWLLWSLA